MRTVHRVISAAALTCLVGLGVTAPAYADDTPKLPIGQVVGLMTHVGSNPDKCLEIGDGRTDTNTKVHQGTCQRYLVSHALYANQKWRLIAAPGLSPDVWGFYHVQLQNLQSGQCMTDSPDGLGAGLDLIVMSDCVTGLKSQRWLIQDWANWYDHGWAFTMENDQNSRGVRVQDDSAQDNALIVGTTALAYESLWVPVTDPAPIDKQPCAICHS